MSEGFVAAAAATNGLAMTSLSGLSVTLEFLRSIAAADPESSGFDIPTRWLLGSAIGLLIAAYVIAEFLRRQPETTINPAVVATFNLRLRAWWMKGEITA